jgi:hypothetical protein
VLTFFSFYRLLRRAWASSLVWTLCCKGFGSCLQHYNERHRPRENCRGSHGRCVRMQTSGSLALSLETQSEGEVGGHFDDTPAGHHSQHGTSEPRTAAGPAYVLCFDWSLSNKSDSIDVLHGRSERHEEVRVVSFLLYYFIISGRSGATGEVFSKGIFANSIDIVLSRSSPCSELHVRLAR